MSSEQVKNILRKLKRLAQDSQLEINELRIVLTLERMVARLTLHPELNQHLVFKGGFVLFKQYQSNRFTRDADALAQNIDKTKLKKLAYQALERDLQDGLWFGDIQVKELQEQGEYGAYRFSCAFQIGEPKKNKVHKLPRIHIDIGFSDQLLVQPPNQKMVSILDFSEPISWTIYWCKIKKLCFHR